MAATPTKASNILNVTPKTKQTICIVCSGTIPNASHRRKLFHGDEKTKSALTLESVLDVSLTLSDLSYICQSCVRKLDTIEAKIVKMKSQFEMNKENLYLRYGQERVKCQAREEREPKKTRRNIAQEYTSVLQDPQDLKTPDIYSKLQHVCVSILLLFLLGDEKTLTK